MTEYDRASLRRMDEQDPLRDARAEYHLPSGLIPLDANSLGPMPRTAMAELTSLLADGWRDGHLRRTPDEAWLELPMEVGASISALIGAPAEAVTVGDSVSVNIAKLVGGALRIAREREVVLADKDSFPTDLYAARSMCESLGGTFKAVPLIELVKHLDDRVAVVLLSQVNFRTGALHNAAWWTDLVHDMGALVVWDLSHSAGPVHVALKEWDADAAVGSTNKFLSGGPGAPSFLYVAPTRLDRFDSPVTGWMGHDRPFDFTEQWRPAPNVRRFLCGTPALPALVLAAAGVRPWLNVDLAAAQRKTQVLGDILVSALADRVPANLYQLAARPHLRGAAVGLDVRVDHYDVVRRLLDRGVAVTGRPPTLRLAMHPLALRYTDMLDAAKVVAEVLSGSGVLPWEPVATPMEPV